MDIEKGRKRFKNIVFYYLPPIAYMALIFYLSSQSFEELQLPEIWNIDKVIHFIEYGILGILWFRALNITIEKTQIIIIIAFAITFIYGISDEIHQYFVPNRNSSIYDAIADGFGAWVGIVLYRKIKAKK
ncbi:MAG: hypothetical protein A2073_03725 [Deltaproteobacteria bacterium GWC2_42_11]|nr:MAG: hypothetical protein A2073_03725 [Deltaproteobacteria bacterium GWC2_42_11]